MGKLNWTLKLFPSRLKVCIKSRKDHIMLMYRTLFYNEFTSFYSSIDTLMEPLFWFVDHFARYLGPIMVTFVVIMITFVVAVFYTCLLPHIVYTSHTVVTIGHLMFGHWLLVNIVFHYLMGAFRNAGHPPLIVANSVSICKKCISPKPARTHHCSVCKCCVLKMDHHCPWLNNCVGFYNHHHFFLFCFYMWMGTLYVSCVGYDLFKQHFYGNSQLIFPDFLYPVRALKDKVMGSVNEDIVAGKENTINVAKDTVENITISYTDKMFHNVVVFEFLLCTAVCIALGLLTAWHSRLISRGETSIELHINNKERKRLKKRGVIFKNPYNLGFRENWKQFFGVNKRRSFWRLVLFPSFHTPEGNGIDWTSSTFQLKKRKYDKNGLQLL